MKSIQYKLNVLSCSKFRNSFHLKNKDILYIQTKGMKVIREHAYTFVKERLSMAYPRNDGKQTPMRGHPVFIAQHATASCCRGCLEKWHKIPKNRELSMDDIEYIVALIMEWIALEMKKAPYVYKDDCKALK